MLAKYQPYNGIKHQVNTYYLHGSNAGTNHCHDHELCAYNDALNTRTAYYSRVYLASLLVWLGILRFLWVQSITYSHLNS
jgi:hypothetical protein